MTVQIVRFPECKRGNTYKHRFPIAFTSGSLADCVIRMMVKRFSSEADADALANIDNALLGGVTIVSATSPATIEIEIADEVTAAFPVKELVAGVQLEFEDGTTEEIENLDERFLVKSDVVHSTASA